jgi:hypothetical protein
MWNHVLCIPDMNTSFRIRRPAVVVAAAVGLEEEVRMTRPKVMKEAGSRSP